MILTYSSSYGHTLQHQNKKIQQSLDKAVYDMKIKDTEKGVI